MLHDNSPRSSAGGPGGLDERSLTDRQHLRSDDSRKPHPAQESYDYNEVENVSPQDSHQHDQEREGGDDEHHISEPHKNLVHKFA